MSRPVTAAVATAVLFSLGPSPELQAQAEPDTTEAAPTQIEPGSGRFLVEGGPGHRDDTLTVHYHRPERFDRRSPVVMVIPGAGRNGDDYRDAWVDASEKHGVLVLSPSYPEEDYPEYWSYNLAGMTDRVTLELDVVLDTDPGLWRPDEVRDRLPAQMEDPHQLFGHSASGHLLHRLVMAELAGALEEIEIRGTSEEPNREPGSWIFQDLDRIFDRVRDELGLETRTYDLFGHSAGGQILHRLALFAPSERLGRILAANAGWYTVPTFERAFPYGLSGTDLSRDQLTEAFSTRLVVFLGEEDDADETRGSLRRTPEANRQGPHRLARGRHFFRTARKKAEKLGVPFRWELVVVPDVGHDYERMGEAAAEHLYGRSGPAGGE